jgi:hypothetical protein
LANSAGNASLPIWGEAIKSIVCRVKRALSAADIEFRHARSFAIRQAGVVKLVVREKWPLVAQAAATLTDKFSKAYKLGGAKFLGQSSLLGGSS